MAPIFVKSGSHPLVSWFCSFVLLFAVHALGVGTCQSASAPSANLVFILDASGSMGAQIQGKMKIDIAKEVLTGLLRDLPAGVNVGLVAYGHRQKADCNDVEELTALGPLDREPLVEKIKALDHKGKTPLTLSVKKVAESLKTQEEETTIILVSDGEETCEGDPCAMVKELKSAGIKFVMHVIGFDVTEKEKTQLSCLAAAGGGSYFTAKNAGELTSAAKKVVEKTEQSSGKLVMKALRNGKPISAWFEVFKAEADASGEKISVATNPIHDTGEELKLVPGKYELVIRNQEDTGNPTLKYSDIVIEAGKTVTKVADFSGGNLKVKALRNGKPVGAWYDVVKAEEGGSGEKEAVASNPVSEEGEIIKLIPGVYDLTIKNQVDAGTPVENFLGITIEAGKTLEKIANFSGGTLKVKAVKNGKPISAWYEVFKAEEGGNGEKESVATNPVGGEGESIKLIPGVYNLTIINQNDAGNATKDFSGIAIEAGKTIEKVAEF